MNNIIPCASNVGLNKAYVGMTHATEHICLLKKLTLNNSTKKQTDALLCSSLSILETYIGALRDDLYSLMSLTKNEVHHD